MPNNTSLCKENKKKPYKKRCSKTQLGAVCAVGEGGGQGGPELELLLPLPKEACCDATFGLKMGVLGAKQGRRGVVMGAAFLALVLRVQHPGEMWGVVPPQCGRGYGIVLAAAGPCGTAKCCSRFCRDKETC